MTKLILIRHGQTEWNLAGRYQGQSNVALSPDGIQQAHHAVLHQIVDLDTGRQPGHQVIGDTLDQWREALDQLILVNLTSSVIHVRKNQA